MKVSRKVGRRSHSSVSRRRLRNKKSYKKNSYRKKHTQRGGKHGKRGRAHKRARTHKHGKRFHRGGKNKPLFGEVEPVSFKWDNETKKGHINNLQYKKNNKEKYDNFSIELSERDGNHKITLSKIDGDSRFSFSFGPLSKDAVINALSAAIQFGQKFEDVYPPESDVTYTFVADRELASNIKGDLKKSVRAPTAVTTHSVGNSEALGALTASPRSDSSENAGSGKLKIHIDDESGKEYYTTSDGKSHWLNGGVPVSKNIIKYTDDDRKEYYYNIDTGKTTYDSP
jgi:hypothetical protein